MNWFLLDASALVKRYATEVGTAVVNHLFARAARPRLLSLMLGAAEVMATLVRKRNGGLLTPASYAATVSQLRAEIVDAADFTKLSSDNALITRSLRLLEKYAINANDAIVLCAALELAIQLRAAGDDLVLVSSDQRLLKAAQAEGLLTFDPEIQDQAALDSLLGP